MSVAISPCSINQIAAGSIGSVWLVIEEIDIWRTAKLMLDQHGSDALNQAAAKREKLMAEHVSDGVTAWDRVILAIGELQRQRLDEPLN